MTAGAWSVECADADGVLIEFNHLDGDGVETFSTAMQPLDALEFALAVADVAHHHLADPHGDEEINT